MKYLFRLSLLFAGLSFLILKYWMNELNELHEVLQYFTPMNVNEWSKSFKWTKNYIAKYFTNEWHITIVPTTTLTNSTDDLRISLSWFGHFCILPLPSNGDAQHSPPLPWNHVTLSVLALYLVINWQHVQTYQQCDLVTLLRVKVVNTESYHN